MAAIITDQLRILNAKNFVDSVQNSSNSYYAWIGLPDAPEFQSDWNSNPPAPKDCLDDSNYYWDTILCNTSHFCKMSIIIFIDKN